MNYETYKTEKSKRTMVWSSFDISSFLREYSTFFTSKPSRTELTAKIDHYVSNWSSISQETRNRCEWECEKCGVSLKGNRGLLHVHHINGVRTDNKDSNLQVLCAICHSEQPMHGHMKVNAEHGQTIRRLRIEQEIRR